VFRAIRIGILLLILFFVAVSTWLTQARSTDWGNSLWVKVYPINADGSSASRDYIAGLDTDDFSDIEEFVARETERYGVALSRPLRMELGQPINEQPPEVEPGSGVLGVMLWSLKMRWWASSTAGAQDSIDPDVRKGMVGIVNARAGRRERGSNNVIIAHEFLHTLGATDKYDPATAQPTAPAGLAEPDKSPLYPQTKAEIMGGRIALAADDAVIPKSLKYAVIGPLTASEIRLID
jgi:hypothetical protein